MEVELEARPCQIIEFFDGTKQLIIPLFQRPYEWGPREWEALWQDLQEQYERVDDGSVAPHFTGAVVTAPARAIPVGVSKFLVIDGQQRLTTIAIIICAIRASFEKSSAKYRKLTRLLINEDEEGLEQFKLLPTQSDRSPFQELIKGEPEPDSRFTKAFDYMRGKLSSLDSDDRPIDLDRMADTIQRRLTVVAINLGETDDPYLIFESLNAKGAPLTQADLIRNYLLLRLHVHDQKTSYEEFWLPMQQRLPGESLSEFMRQYLMSNGDDVAKSAVYSVLKRKLSEVPDDTIPGSLRALHNASVLYAQIAGHTPHPVKAIEHGLTRLRRWEVATANPLLLKLLTAYAEGRLENQAVESCLKTVESFVVRRAFCAVPTNQLKRIFLTLAKDLPLVDVPIWLSGNLASGQSGRRWPKNDEFKRALLSTKIYSPPLERCKFILECLERCHTHKEPAEFSDATIEHVMPRMLTSAWKSDLGPTYTSIHEQWLDTLSNLTLTGYNSELSNLPFVSKRRQFAESHFALNRWIAAKTAWTAHELEERGEVLFELAVSVWQRP